MFNDNSVGNAGDAVTFVETYLGKKCSCWYKKNSFPFAGYNFGKNIGGKNCGRTAAAASSCVGILCLVVIDQDSAILMYRREIDILLAQKIQKDFFPITPRSPVKTAS